MLTTQTLPRWKSHSKNSRIAYLEVATGRLVTLDLGPLHLKGAHNIQIDAQGTIWATVEHAAEEDGEEFSAILEVDLDFLHGGVPTQRLDSLEGRLVVHQLPKDLGGSSRFDVHGLQIIVDERSKDGRRADRFVWLSDANATNGTGRIALLRPGTLDEKSTVGSEDAWYEWNLDEALEAEQREGDGHALFIAVDDNESPGIPDDDQIVFGDSGRPRQPQGLVRRLEPQNVLEAIRLNAPLPASSVVQSVRVFKSAGAVTGTRNPSNYAGTVQAQVDREGNVTIADTSGGLVRFNFEDFDDRNGNAIPANTPKPRIDAPVKRIDGLSVTSQVARFVVTNDALMREDTPHVVTEAFSPERNVDRSLTNGIDQYEVAASVQRSRAGGREITSFGPFRGTLNAGSVFYNSLSESDNLTTTVFAETVRRQVEAVESKAALPAGATLGRLAFSVRRDGSLILTGREDGSVLDVQLNLSQLVSGMPPGAIPPRFLLEGEPNVVIGDDGTVTLFAVDQSPAHSLVRYRFQPSVSKTMKKVDFADPARWSVTTFAPPTDSATGTLLVGEPTAYLDGQGNAGALATTEKGHLVLYRPQLGPGFVDLKEYLTGSANLPAPEARPFVFSSVAIVPAGNNLFVYGTNMAGDLVEYVLENVDLPAGSDSVTNLSITSAKVLNETRPASQLPRDTQVFQDVYAIGGGQKNHVFAGDGNARLVHFEIDRESGAVQAENVTELARDARQLFGYFPFQQEFGGRVYAEIAPLFVNGELFVYGTNGQDLIEFRRPVGGVWQAANLSNDLYSTSGANRGGPGQPPVANKTNGRFPANFVFGAPGAYVSPDGDRHILQINADGEIIEYYFDTAANPFARFHTQNITLRLAPSASADNYRTAPGRTLDVPFHEGLLANDRDPGGLPLTVRVFQGPANGTLRLDPTGSFEYVPSAGFVGQDQFTYEALNGINESKLITVTIAVEQLPVGTILDDGNAGYSNTGSWRARTSAAGVGGDFRESAKGTGKDVATWSLKGLPKNANREFEVFVHWVPQSNLATDAPLVIYDNKTVVGGKRINEQRAPFGDEAAGVIWQSLGKVKINSGTLKVTLGDNANGTVVADAVRIVPVTPTAAAPTTAAPPAASTALLLVGPQPVDTWHNAAQPANVNNDSQGVINSLDLLAVLNWLTAQGGPATLPASGNPSATGFIDVNNDGQCNSLDLLAVINAITAAQTSTGLEPNPEGESVTGIPQAAGIREVTSPDLIELLAIDSLTTRRRALAPGESESAPLTRSNSLEVAA